MIAELRIDLGAIVRNVDALAALVAPARVVPVIKSNAYGHGLIEVAQALDGRVARLAVYDSTKRWRCARPESAGRSTCSDRFPRHRSTTRTPPA